MDQLASKYIGRLLVTKLDGDHSPKTVSTLGIRGYPTVLLFEGGKEVKRQTGVPQGGSALAMLEDMVKDVLKD